jgi:hypothetical protein
MPNAKKVVTSFILKSFLSSIHIYMPVCLVLLTLLASKVPDIKFSQSKVFKITALRRMSES